MPDLPTSPLWLILLEKQREFVVLSVGLSQSLIQNIPIHHTLNHQTNKALLLTKFFSFLFLAGGAVTRLSRLSIYAVDNECGWIVMEKKIGPIHQTKILFSVWKRRGKKKCLKENITLNETCSSCLCLSTCQCKVVPTAPLWLNLLVGRVWLCENDGGGIDASFWW